MKKIILLSLYLVLITLLTISWKNTNAQTWKPNLKYTTSNRDTATKKVQCWGTVRDHKTHEPRQCLLKGTPNAGSKFYCHYHINQQ